MYDLKGKVAMVTGAGRQGGIGAAVARRLARDGARVVLADICAPPTNLSHAGCGQWEELAAIAEEIGGLPVRVDVSDV
ncbi:MAG: oxidoreductase, partial [Chloroflexi bacterium]|nr:oxidoreductase [Chloroflexota bacterium]